MEIIVIVEVIATSENFICKIVKIIVVKIKIGKSKVRIESIVSHIFKSES